MLHNNYKCLEFLLNISIDIPVNILNFNKVINILSDLIVFCTNNCNK